MNKRRKYDIKNKRSFIIILILSVVIVGIFSLFIYNYSKASKIQYKIESGSVLQDVDKNYLNIDDDVLLKMRWNGNYYLVYNGKQVTLGKKVIVYNMITGGMKLYGSFYEISSDGKIIEHKNETVLANTTDARFYKLDDREYLLVDTKIYSEDYLIEASNYLLVELDKLGNAKLSNNKINLKTISPTTLVTSKYTFDIANEILNFGQYDIDLKKIIGSTNQYNPNGYGSGGGSGSGGTGSGTGSGGGSGSGGTGGSGIGTGGGTGSGDVINNNDTGKVPDIGEIMDKIKMTSIIRVVECIEQIDVDYVIYDPYNEYGSVYVEIVSDDKIEVVHLSKLDTHVTLDKLKPDTNYKLNFIYTTEKVDEETQEKEYVPYTFEKFEVKTKKPEYLISVYKISKVYNTLTYKVNLQSGFAVSKVNVNLSFDYEEADHETGEMIKKNASLDSSVDVVNLTTGYVLGNFDISGYDIAADAILKLTVNSVVSSEFELPINTTYTFRFGR